MRNIAQQLTDKEIRNVLECLNLVLMEDFFEEWEFETLFGVERALYFKLKHSWPNVDIDDINVENMLTNAMNNSLGYPWGNEKMWKQHFSATPKEVEDTLKKIIFLCRHQ